MYKWMSFVESFSAATIFFLSVHLSPHGVGGSLLLSCEMLILGAFFVCVWVTWLGGGCLYVQRRLILPRNSFGRFDKSASPAFDEEQGVSEMRSSSTEESSSSSLLLLLLSPEAISRRGAKSNLLPNSPLPRLRWDEDEPCSILNRTVRECDRVYVCSVVGGYRQHQHRGFMCEGGVRMMGDGDL